MGVEFGLGGGGGGVVGWGWGWGWGGGEVGVEVGSRWVCTFPYRVYPYGSQYKNTWMALSDRVIDYCIGMTTVQVENKIIFTQYSLLYLKDIKNL